MHGEANPWIRTWIVAALLALASPDSHRSQSGSPNLRPVRPSDWSDAIVVSTQPETTVDSTLLTTIDTLYIDWAVGNSGAAATEGAFRVSLLVDGTLRESWTRSPLCQYR